MNNTATSLEYLGVPDKSANDKKNYKLLILRNGLKVLLVSDISKTNTKVSGAELSDSIVSSTTKSNEQNEIDNKKLSAVALLVDVGSFTQPKEYQGLAHFLEHMVLLGSKKYPKENSFDAHITKNGGSYNASTDSEETVYYFEVPEKYLDSSMDYFSAQLQEPLLMEESMTREREAIESEFQLIVNNDVTRRNQLLQSLANEHYPHKNFTWGNLKSLKEEIENDTVLHKSLHEFYKKHYSAHRMYSCIQAPLSIAELEYLAVKYFGNIGNYPSTGLDFSQYVYRRAFRQEFYEEVFFVKPIENICKLDLTWVLPPILKLYKCKPADFLSYLLGYEGEGSLCAYLRKRLWAFEVMSSADTNPMFTLFNLNISLTELGFKHLDNVLKATFAYIKLYNSASQLKEIYQELSTIRLGNFRYNTNINPGKYVQYLVRCCKYYPTEDILTAPNLYYEYNVDQVQNVIDHLQEFHFNIMITSKQNYDGIQVYDKKEKWFGTEYTTKKVPRKWLNMWNNILEMPELYLPKTNNFIAQDFHIFCEENNTMEFDDAPRMLIETDLYELWFRQDDKFHLPHACMYFYLQSPFLRDDKNNILCTLYLNLVQHYLQEELYPAVIAGINYQIYCSEKGIVLGAEGYNEKLYLVLEIIIKALISTKDHISEFQLETFKKELQRNYFNVFINPDAVYLNLYEYIVKDKSCLMIQKYKNIIKITLQDIQEFASEFAKEIYVQSLMQGNLEQETALQTMKSIMAHLNCSAVKERSELKDRGTEIPLGCHKILCHNLNPNDCNTIVANFYQTGPRSIRNECILNLIIMIMETPLYNTLRTKEQLSYCVKCSLQNNNGIMGYLIYISSQETKYASHYVEERIEEFRSGIQQYLEELSVEDFENFKKSFIKLKEMNDLSLHDEVYRNWLEITTEEYMFSRGCKEVQVLRALEKQDILEFWRSNETTNFRKLSIQIVGSALGENDNKKLEDDQNMNNFGLKFFDFDKHNKDNSFVDNIEKFKENLYVYPVVKTKLEE